ncbi:MAG: hypothetical protein KC657_17325 [Myxococcales bacterium]|nr:hypothetical protein [Myxococcales bacterium]
MPRALTIYATLREDLTAAALTTLAGEVRTHYEALVVAQETNELIAVDLAEALCVRLEELLKMAHLLDPESRAHIVGASRYFVSSIDEKPDEDSCTGLDDDVAVFNHVVRLLGRDDLIITD